MTRRQTMARRGAASRGHGLRGLLPTTRQEAVAATGMALLFVWEFYKNARTYPTPDWAWWLHPYGFTFVALVMVAALARRRRSLEGNAATSAAIAKERGRTRRLDVVCAVVMTVSTLVFSRMPGLRFPDALLITSLVVADACLAWLYTRWVVLIARMPTMAMASVVICSCMAAALTKMLLPLLPDIAQAIALVVVAAAAGLTLTIAQTGSSGLFDHSAPGPAAPTPSNGARATSHGAGGLVYTRETWGSLWKVGACMAAFTLAYAVVNMIMKVQFGSFAFGASPLPWVSLASRAVEVAACIAILWWAFVHRGRFAFVAMWRVLVCLITAALLMVLAVGNSPAVQVVTSPAIMLAVVLYLMMLADVVRRAEVDPHLVVTAGLLFYMVPSFVGRLAVATAGVARLTPSVALALLAIVALVTAFCAMDPDANARSILAEFNDAPLLVEDFRLIDERCDLLAAQYRLSEREAQVMQLLVRGRSKRHIAEALCLSENTVRTYAKRIYDKLGIHSRDELVELVSPEG